MVNLLVLTEKAAAQVKEIFAAENIDPETPLRVKVVGGGCAGFQYDLYVDTEGATEADQTFCDNGVNLLVDQMSLMYLVGTTIDFVDDSLMGAGFKFDNPSVKTTCGCGSSFN